MANQLQREGRHDRQVGLPALAAPLCLALVFLTGAFLSCSGSSDPPPPEAAVLGEKASSEEQASSGEQAPTPLRSPPQMELDEILLEEMKGVGTPELQNWVDPAVEKAVFYVVWREDEGVEPLLIRPDGLRIPRREFANHGIEIASQESRHQVDSAEVTQVSAFITVPDPDLGLWRFSMDGDCSGCYVLTILNEVKNRLVVGSLLTFDPQAGPAVVLKAALLLWSEDAFQPSDLRMLAYCPSTPEEKPRALDFRDDGTGWDEQADDGIFTHALAPATSSEAGLRSFPGCDLQAMMIGRVDGRPFIRRFSQTFEPKTCHLAELTVSADYELWHEDEVVARFVVREITPEGEVLASRVDPENDASGPEGTRHRLPLDEALCGPFEIQPAGADPPAWAKTPVESDSVLLEGHLVDRAGAPIEAELEIRWLPDGQAEQKRLETAKGSFKIEQQTRGMDVLISKEEYFPVRFQLPEGSDHTCRDLRIELWRDYRYDPNWAFCRRCPVHASPMLPGQPVRTGYLDLNIELQRAFREGVARFKNSDLVDPEALPIGGLGIREQARGEKTLYYFTIGGGTVAWMDQTATAYETSQPAEHTVTLALDGTLTRAWSEGWPELEVQAGEVRARLRVTEIARPYTTSAVTLRVALNRSSQSIDVWPFPPGSAARPGESRTGPCEPEMLWGERLFKSFRQRR